MSTPQVTRSKRAPLLKTLLFSALCSLSVTGCKLQLNVGVGKDAGSNEASAVQKEVDRMLLEQKFLTTVCLDGVQYWAQTIHSLTLTPRFDPETKEVRTCSTTSTNKEKSSQP